MILPTLQMRKLSHQCQAVCPCHIGQEVAKPTVRGQALKQGSVLHLEGPHVPGARELTWEPIIVKVPQAGDALPKVCVVRAIPSQRQLLLEGSLGNRMEVKNKTIKTRAQMPPSQSTSIDRKHLGRITGTQTSLSWWHNEFLSPVLQEGLRQPEMHFRGKENVMLANDYPPPCPNTLNEQTYLPTYLSPQYALSFPHGTTFFLQSCFKRVCTFLLFLSYAFQCKFIKLFCKVCVLVILTEGDRKSRHPAALGWGEGGGTHHCTCYHTWLGAEFPEQH